MPRLSEMTDEQLIKQVEDDALAREIFIRLVLGKLRVSDEVQALEHQRDKIQGDYEKAMDEAAAWEKQHRETMAYYEHAIQQATRRVNQLEGKTASYESGRTCPNCQGWGCNKCCSSDAEIRAKQGTFG